MHTAIRCKGDEGGSQYLPDKQQLWLCAVTSPLPLLGKRPLLLGEGDCAALPFEGKPPPFKRTFVGLPTNSLVSSLVSITVKSATAVRTRLKLKAGSQDCISSIPAGLPLHEEQASGAPTKDSAQT